MEQPEFIGRKYQEGEKELGVKSLDKWATESLKPLEGEMQKTEEQIKIIDAINNFIGNELKSLGIDTFQPIEKERIHFLTKEQYQKAFPGNTDRAFYRSTSDAIFINGNDIKPTLFATLIHECIHRVSVKKFYITPENGLRDARVGYRTHSDWKDTRTWSLEGFNMNDITVYTILLKNTKTLQENFGITWEDINGPIFAYMDSAGILMAVFKKIAEDKKISTQDVMQKFIRGHFEGSFLVLKDIEYSFGKGSIELLARLNTLDSEEDNTNLIKMLELYFKEFDAQKREEIKKEIELSLAKIKSTERID